MLPPHPAAVRHGATEPVTSATRARQPLWWVPSLYLAMGIPFNAIMGGTAARMYKSLGHTDAQITIALGSIGVAWTLKPLWAALLEMAGTTRSIVLATEFILALLLAGIALTLPVPEWTRLGIALLWVAAFASATHDIAADGLYLRSLTKVTQARMAGLQGTFWTLGKVLVTGALITVLDRVRVTHQWSEMRMWMTVWMVCAIALLALAAAHCWTLPAGAAIGPRPQNARQAAQEFVDAAVTFFHKPMLWGMLAFVFLYRFGEGLILMEGQLFLQSPLDRGGLGLSAGEVSTIDAVWGTLAAILGGLLGGAFVARFGLARVVLILALCLNVPNLAYVYLSQVAAHGQGANYATIVTLVSVEKFGYGFGFVGNMIYMMQQLAPGRRTMAHYAFSTAIMNLMLVPTNMISGPLADWLGFSTFFIVVMVASVPSVWVAWRAPFPIPAVGVKTGAADGVGPEEPAERAVLHLAGRASLYAMLVILVILVLDTRILGVLYGAAPGHAGVPLALLGLFAALKTLLSIRSLRFVREAARAAENARGTVDLQNALGARCAVVLCGVVSLGVLALGVRLAW